MENKRVYFIEGDGIGPEIFRAAKKVIDRAVEVEYNGEKKIEWIEILAGEKAFKETGSYLPDETLKTLKQEAEVAIKGPLTTPVGAGFRSLNVTLRQTFDLYACIRPVRYFKGLETPVKHPELVDMVIFRENTEDVYAGIEWEAGAREARKLIDFIKQELEVNIDPLAAIGIKPITEFGSKRLIRKAIRYAIENKRKSVTLMHKGNIMKFTEGGFRKWGYEVMEEEEFRSRCVREGEDGVEDKVIIKDRIADNMFQQILTRPAEYDVIATTNLNGDYISDALAAQVGGLGLAPGANIGDDLALFEPTHGSVPKRAGTDTANPCSLILSGALMLDYMGWSGAAKRIEEAIEKAIARREVTQDLARLMDGAKVVGCQRFGEIIAENL